MSFLVADRLLDVNKKVLHEVKVKMEKMDIEIKVEPNSGSTCHICLKTDVQTFGEHGISSEITSIYKELLKDHLTHLKAIGTTEMCPECMEILNDVTEFKKKCVSSIEILSAKIKFGEGFLSPLEELKEEIFVADLPLYENTPPDESPRRVAKKNPTKRQKIPEVEIKVDTETKTEEPTNAQQEKETLVRRRPSSKKKTGYCYICCMSHATIHRHVLDVHSRTFEDGVLRCLWCNEACDDVQGVLDHLKAAHREFEYPKKCGNCEMETKSRETLFKHVHETHYANYKKIYPCDFCNAVYNEITTYKYHVHCHLGAVKCRHCDKSFYDNKKREAHMKEHEQKLEATCLSCHFCSYNSKYKTLLVKHMFIHHMDKQIKCDFCDRVFKAKHQLSMHMKRTHEERRFICNVCGSKFFNSSTLNKHVILHSFDVVKPLPKTKRPETKEFACDQCDMKFYINATLKRHKYSHTKTRPFPCHMCPKGYYMNKLIQKHYRREHKLTYSPKEIRKLCGRQRHHDDSD